MKTMNCFEIKLLHNGILRVRCNITTYKDTFQLNIGMAYKRKTKNKYKSRYTIEFSS